MRHPTTRALFAYWDDLRAGRFAPTRSEVEPADIGPLLPNAFILERTGPEAARFRLSGGAVCDLIGMDLNGMSAAALWDESSRGRVLQMIEAVVSAPATATALGRVPAKGAMAGAEAEFCFLPLRSHQGRIDRILGGAALLDGTERWSGGAPRFFSLQDLRLTAIDSDEPAEARPDPYASSSAPAATAMGEAAAPFELKAIDGKFAHEERSPIATPDRSRPHLRVVRDDE